MPATPRDGATPFPGSHGRPSVAPPEALTVEHSERRVYAFEEGRADMKQVLGGKGANLAEMARIGLPVPHGFTITAQECVRYQQSGAIDDALRQDIEAAMAALEAKAGARFGDRDDPLLVSVRSGAAVSMPGMMDTVLNLGLNDDTVEGLAKATGDARFAYDCYRRFLTMFSDVVLGLDHGAFEAIYQDVKRQHGQERGQDLEPAAMKDMVRRMKALVEAETGQAFPQDPETQLLLAVEAVFKSWDIPRARTYRRLNKISDAMGTAVNVQMMVFGNMATTAPPASPSPATPAPARTASSASSCETPRARTSSPASARRNPSARCTTSCPKRTTSSWTSPRNSKATSATCRTSSSR